MAEVRNIDTRERILDAAERLFMAHGYEGDFDAPDYRRTRRSIWRPPTITSGRRNR